MWRAIWELVADQRPIWTASAVSRNPWAHHATESASVLASVNVASSPSSPSSPCSTPSPVGDTALCAAPGGSGRSVDLRSARLPYDCVGDGRTGASGGGSELRVAAVRGGRPPR